MLKISTCIALSIPCIFFYILQCAYERLYSEICNIRTLLGWAKSVLNSEVSSFQGAICTEHSLRLDEVSVFHRMSSFCRVAIHRFQITVHVCIYFCRCVQFLMYYPVYWSQPRHPPLSRQQMKLYLTMMVRKKTLFNPVFHVEGRNSSPSDV
jgi:hypothetical protein